MRSSGTDWAAAGRRVKRAIAGALLLAGLAATAPALAAGLPAPWVELRADGGLDLRALVAPNAACPQAAVDGAAVTMQPQTPADAAFPVRLCRAAAPLGARRLAVGSVGLPILAAHIDHIIVFGDSGCRLEGAAVQDCDDPVAWPFPTVARLAAARRPDLVIQVGDYYYRETACPSGHAGCAGSPYGDNWGVWQADFFAPAAPLLAAAPWVVVRGNHELCRRGGEGWFRLLDPQPPAGGCADRTPPYLLRLGGLDLIVFDDADADDGKAAPDKVAAFRAQLQPILQQAPPHSWLVMHRPLWARIEGPAGTGFALNATMQAAIRGLVPPSLDLVLSGHIHDLMSFTFGPDRPAQLVAGTGGDTLTRFFGPTLPGTVIDGMPVLVAFALQRWGYLMLDRSKSGWTGTAYSTEDRVLARCDIGGRVITCRPNDQQGRR
jgi:hypothetical protein